MPRIRKRPTKVAWPFLLNRASSQSKGLIGWWPGIGNGRVLDDMSGFRNHGALTNFASPMTSTSGWAPGVVGLGKSALAFDGVDDVVNMNPTFPNINNPFYLSMWVKYNTTARMVVYSKDDTLGPGALFSFELNHFEGGTGSFGFRFHNDAGSANCLGYATGISTGSWFHIGLRRNSVANGDFSLSLNGRVVSVTFTATDATVNPTTYARLGGRVFTGSPLTVDGFIDDPRVYNRALSASEIAGIYQRPGELRWVPRRKVFSFTAAAPATSSNFFQMF